MTVHRSGYRETFEWLIRVEASHLGSGYANTAPAVKRSVCAASSYEIVKEFQCSSSAAGRW